MSNLFFIFVLSKQTAMSNFQSTENKGFQLTFSNGLTISVQFGKANYCSNRNKENDAFVTECDNAEVSIWDKDNNVAKIGGVECLGWVNADDVAEWINKTKNAKNILDIQ